jgi:hypothetical protein
MNYLNLIENVRIMCEKKGNRIIEIIIDTKKNDEEKEATSC